MSSTAIGYNVWIQLVEWFLYFPDLHSGLIQECSLKYIYIYINKIVLLEKNMLVFCHKWEHYWFVYMAQSSKTLNLVNSCKIRIKDSFFLSQLFCFYFTLYLMNLSVKDFLISMFHWVFIFFSCIVRFYHEFLVMWLLKNIVLPPFPSLTLFHVGSFHSLLMWGGVHYGPLNYIQNQWSCSLVNNIANLLFF